jgi:hypothetical protein
MNPEKRLTITDYLAYLEQRGIEKGYFEVFAMKDIHKSCCTDATIEVIDFDKVKDKIVKEEDLVTVKSCDCLKILPEKGRIDFIEIKSFKALIDNFKQNDLDKAIDKQVEKFNFRKKIKDSLHILETLTRKNDFGRTELDEIHYDNVTIHYIVLTDVNTVKNSFNYIAFSLIFLSQYSTSPENFIQDKISKKLATIPKLRPNLNTPTLKSCSEIDAYYH